MNSKALGQPAEICVIYLPGPVQGLSLVTFPAASNIFTSTQFHNLTSSEYGYLFLPLIACAILASILSGVLDDRLGLKPISWSDCNQPGADGSPRPERSVRGVPRCHLRVWLDGIDEPCCYESGIDTLPNFVIFSERMAVTQNQKPSIFHLIVLCLASVLVITFALFAQGTLQFFNGVRKTV